MNKRQATDIIFAATADTLLYRIQSMDICRLDNQDFEQLEALLTISTIVDRTAAFRLNKVLAILRIIDTSNFDLEELARVNRIGYKAETLRTKARYTK